MREDRQLKPKHPHAPRLRVRGKYWGMNTTYISKIVQAPSPTVRKYLKLFLIRQGAWPIETVNELKPEWLYQFMFEFKTRRDDRDDRRYVNI